MARCQQVKLSSAKMAQLSAARTALPGSSGPPTSPKKRNVCQLLFESQTRGKPYEGPFRDMLLHPVERTITLDNFLSTHDSIFANGLYQEYKEKLQSAEGVSYQDILQLRLLKNNYYDKSVSHYVGIEKWYELFMELVEIGFHEPNEGDAGIGQQYGHPLSLYTMRRIMTSGRFKRLEERYIEQEGELDNTEEREELQWWSDQLIMLFEEHDYESDRD